MNTTIDMFVQRLIDEKKLAGLDPEVKTQVVKDLTDRVEDRINATVLASLPPDKIPEFTKLLETGNEEAAHAFVGANIPNLDEIIAAELLQFKHTYLNI